MAYIRDYLVTVGGVTFAPEIDVKFLTKQATVQSSAQAEIRLYNLADATAQSIPTSGVEVQLMAGYQDEGTQLIYAGTLRQRRIGREDTVTTFVDLFCNRADAAYNFGTVSKTLAAGSKPMDHVNAAVQGMSVGGAPVSLGYVTPGLLDQPSYPRAVTWHNMARDVVRTVAQSVGAEWWIDEQYRLNIVAKTDQLPGTIAVNSGTGLIGQPIETPDGIEVRTLLSANITVGSLLQIDQSSIQRAQLDQSYQGQGSQSTTALQHLGTNDGVYKVLYIERRGHLRGQEWYNDCTCIGATSGIIPQGLTQTIGDTGIGSDRPTFGGGNGNSGFSGAQVG